MLCQVSFICGTPNIEFLVLNNSFQGVKRDLMSIHSAQEIIQEDIENTCSKMPSVSSNCLKEKFSESWKYREKLIKRTEQIQTKIETETLNNEIDVTAHLECCKGWLNDLQSMLEHKVELYQNSATVHDQLKILQVILAAMFRYVLFCCCISEFGSAELSLSFLCLSYVNIQAICMLSFMFPFAASISMLCSVSRLVSFFILLKCDFYTSFSEFDIHQDALSLFHYNFTKVNVICYRLFKTFLFQLHFSGSCTLFKFLFWKI